MDLVAASMDKLIEVWFCWICGRVVLDFTFMCGNLVLQVVNPWYGNISVSLAPSETMQFHYMYITKCFTLDQIGPSIPYLIIYLIGCKWCSKEVRTPVCFPMDPVCQSGDGQCGQCCQVSVCPLREFVALAMLHRRMLGSSKMGRVPQNNTIVKGAPFVATFGASNTMVIPKIIPTPSQNN